LLPVVLDVQLTDHSFGFATVQERLQENLDSVAVSGDMELKEANKDTWTEEAVPQRGWQWGKQREQ